MLKIYLFNPHLFPSMEIQIWSSLFTKIVGYRHIGWYIGYGFAMTTFGLIICGAFRFYCSISNVFRIWRACSILVYDTCDYFLAFSL